ncbi:MAG TPA: hypothetical protein VNZ26_11190 [Vicinamibacterales bacterium]|jgi:hypothetical protein|nr:hypothetical protein [Vicinamibacterales bacterium]
MPDHELIDLARVSGDKRPWVRLPGGREHAVEPPNGIAYRRLQRAEKMPPGTEQTMEMYAIGQLLVPSATQAEVDGLSEERLFALFELAKAPIQAMEKYIALRVDARNPNGTGDETTGQLSSPTTGSATSATASPTPPASLSELSSVSPSPSPSTPMP